MVYRLTLLIRLLCSEHLIHLLQGTETGLGNEEVCRRSVSLQQARLKRHNLQTVKKPKMANAAKKK
jgi:hypothetical protein